MPENHSLSPRVTLITAGLVFIAAALLMFFEINLAWLNFFYAPACALLVALLYIKQITRISTFLIIAAMPGLWFLAVYPFGIMQAVTLQLPVPMLFSVFAYVVYVAIRCVLGLVVADSEKLSPKVLPLAYVAALILSTFALPALHAETHMLRVLIFLVPAFVGMGVVILNRGKLTPFSLFAILSTVPVLVLLITGMIVGQLGNLLPSMLLGFFFITLVVTSVVYFIYWAIHSLAKHG